MTAGETLDRSGYELEVDERFEGSDLDRRLWLRHYLPHWSSRDASLARFDVGGGKLRLRIDVDQPPWNPRHDGWLRASALQTGEFAGPVGSSIGQLRFTTGLVVREEQPAAALYTPRYGPFEIRLSGIADPANMVALWMIGYEDDPERSGEICICEVFGREMSDGHVRIGMGIHPWADPALSDDFDFVPVGIDAREPHWYAARWTPERVSFYVDGREVKVVDQSPAYPMQFMLSLYEFADGPEPASPPDRYPKIAMIERFRGWRPTSGPGARPPALAPASMKDHLSTEQVGWILERSPASVREMIEDGEIEARRIPAGYRIAKAEVLRLARARIESEAGQKVSDRELGGLIDQVIETNSTRTERG